MKEEEKLCTCTFSCKTCVRSAHVCIHMFRTSEKMLKIREAAAARTVPKVVWNNGTSNKKYTS